MDSSASSNPLRPALPGRFYDAHPLLHNEETKKSWAEAVPSTHLWVADLPDDLGPGVYTLTVRATDEFGRAHHAHRILEITGSPVSSAGSTWNPTE